MNLDIDDELQVANRSAMLPTKIKSEDERSSPYGQLGGTSAF